MYQPKTRTRYLHINSKHRLDTNNTDEANIKVHLHQPIKNVSKVAVKSFTMGNSLHNIRSGENTLNWVENYAPVGTSEYFTKEFSITIPTGYYTAEELCVAVNNLITAMPSHSVLSETPLVMVFTQDTDNYHIKLSLSTTTGDGDKWFTPVNEKNSSIWKLLGFVNSQIISKMKRKAKELDDIANVLPNPSTAYPYYNALFQAGTTATPAQYRGVLPATIESPSGVYLTSETLTSGGTYETRTNPDSHQLEAIPQSILEFVQFDKSRFSWIHYNSPMPHWHHLNDTSIHDLDIQVRSENGTTFNHNEIGEYNIVLVFECVVEDEFSAEYIKQYNKEGYNLAHTPERFTLK